MQALNNGSGSRRVWTALEPLRERTYRRIWSASILSNFGQLILGVGAAWEIDTARSFSLWSIMRMGHLTELARRLPLVLSDGQASSHYGRHQNGS